MGGTCNERNGKIYSAARTMKNGEAGHLKNYGFNFRILVSDIILSFMWVWCGPMIQILVHRVLGLKRDTVDAEIIGYSIAIINMIFFAALVDMTKGGAYNPLMVLASSISGDFNQFLFTFGGRIPAQVFGSIVGVRVLLGIFPGIGKGPQLGVHIHHGALVEGILTFIMVSISLGLARNLGGSFYTKNWISSVSKTALQILGADLTGGCMNPAPVIGWAYARGDHLTKEHFFVYWLAPAIATMMAVWVSKILSRNVVPKNKSD